MKQLIIILIAFCLLLPMSVVAEASAPKVLFQSTDVFDLTVLTDWERVYNGKYVDVPNDRPYVRASFVHQKDGENLNMVGNLRVRGWDRRVNCDFPPLKIKRIKEKHQTGIPKSYITSKGTWFHKSKALKMVTRCNSEERKRWTHLEHVIYKLYEVVTDLSFKTRGVNLTVRDRNEFDFDVVSGRVIDSHYAFLIEPAKDFAKRNNLEYLETYKFSRKDVSAFPMNIMYMFNLMIGNYDVEISRNDVRNVKLFQKKSAGGAVLETIPVPYDFDWAQIIRDGKIDFKRRLTGLCGLTSNSYSELKSLFRSKESELRSVVNNGPLLKSDEKKMFLSAISKFMSWLDWSSSTGRKIKRKAKRSCR